MVTKRREIVRLLGDGIAQDKICTALGCSKRDVSAVARILKEGEINKEELENLTEADIRQLVLPQEERISNFIQPNYEYIIKELAKPHVTRKLLWHEYGSTTVPEGKKLYQYSQFCSAIDKHLAVNGATARIKHISGRITYIDWAGDTLVLRSRTTGKDTKIYLFVACLPYSGYFYVEGFPDLTLRSWIAGHIHAFEFFGGITDIITPDNCATATDRTPIYITKINSTYAEFAEHMQSAVIPTRIRRPKDKSGVESAVLLCERWICAALRNEVFFSLDEINDVIGRINANLNARPFQIRQGSRESVFLEEEKSQLKELPAQRYEICEWKKAKVAHDYHVQVDYMRYSVDYRLISQTLDVRLSDSKVDIYCPNEVVVTHWRLFGRKGQFSTIPEHMPPNHRYGTSSWSAERFLSWATSVGPATNELIADILASKPVIEQTFVSCANILGLSKKGRRDLLEAACSRIAETRCGSTVSYTKVKNTMEALKKYKEVFEPTESFDVGLSDMAPSIGRTRDASYYRREQGDCHAK